MTSIYKELPINDGIMSSTWSNLPDPTTVAPYIEQYLVTDFPFIPHTVFSDGAKWKITQHKTYYVAEASPNTTTSTTEVIIKSCLVPAGFLKIGDYVDFAIAFTKNNSTNAQTIVTRIGNAGTTSDTLLATTSSAIAAATTANTIRHSSFIVKSATTIQIVQGTAATNFNTSTSVVTIPDISTAIYLSFGVFNVTSTATIFSQHAYDLAITK